MTDQASSGTSSNYMDLAADIVSAFVSNNSVPANEFPALIPAFMARSETSRIRPHNRQRRSLLRLFQ